MAKSKNWHNFKQFCWNVLKAFILLAMFFFVETLARTFGLGTSFACGFGFVVGGIAVWLIAVKMN